MDADREYAVASLLFDYVKSPSLRHLRDPHSVEKLARDIVKAIDRASLVWSNGRKKGRTSHGRRLQTLDLADALLGLRAKLLARAGDNLDTLIPAYTNGVQAVPITYGLYLLAHEESFERDQQRISEAYRRLNLSPMGTGVMSDSVWPLNRRRLAELLGFDGIVENSMDSSQVIPSDNQLEATAIASSSAIRTGAMMQDLHTQYHQVRPWLLLQEGSTYTSQLDAAEAQSRAHHPSPHGCLRRGRPRRSRGHSLPQRDLRHGRLQVGSRGARRVRSGRQDDQSNRPRVRCDPGQ